MTTILIILIIAFVLMLTVAAYAAARIAGDVDQRLQDNDE